MHTLKTEEINNEVNYFNYEIRHVYMTLTNFYNILPTILRIAQPPPPESGPGKDFDEMQTACEKTKILQESDWCTNLLIHRIIIATKHFNVPSYNALSISQF